MSEVGYTVSTNSNASGRNTPLVLALERRCFAVDCRNGTINECVNGTLQSKEQGYNTNSNNVVLVFLS